MRKRFLIIVSGFKMRGSGDHHKEVKQEKIRRILNFIRENEPIRYADIRKKGNLNITEKYFPINSGASCESNN